MGCDGYIHLYSVKKLKELGLYDQFYMYYRYKGEYTTEQCPFLKEDVIYYYDGDNVDDPCHSDEEEGDWEDAFLGDWFIWT